LKSAPYPLYKNARLVRAFLWVRNSEHRYFRAELPHREAAKNPDDGKRIQRLGGAENMLTKALANFYAVAENYPDLKANETIQRLMEELSSTENRVSFARQAYNDTVMTYNTYREQFPNNVIAGLFAFQETSQLQLETPEARHVPKVSF